MYKESDIPMLKGIHMLEHGVYVMRSKDGFYASKKAPNMKYFMRAIKNPEEYIKDAQNGENVSKFDSINDLLNYLNEMPKPKKFNKDRHLKAALDSLPIDQKKAVVQGILENPTLKIGVQKSLQLGFNDLPLFGGSEDKQMKMF